MTSNQDREIKTENNKSMEKKQINPFTDKGNYVVQIVDNNQVIKEVLAVNSTVRIISLGEQAVASVLK